MNLLFNDLEFAVEWFTHNMYGNCVNEIPLIVHYSQEGHVILLTMTVTGGVHYYWTSFNVGEEGHAVQYSWGLVEYEFPQ